MTIQRCTKCETILQSGSCPTCNKPQNTPVQSLEDRSERPIWLKVLIAALLLGLFKFIFAALTGGVK